MVTSPEKWSWVEAVKGMACNFSASVVVEVMEVEGFVDGLIRLLSKDFLFRSSSWSLISSRDLEFQTSSLPHRSL
jgi:hypothetical protein